MPNKVAIITDNTVYLPKECLEKVRTRPKAVRRILDIAAQRLIGRPNIRVAVTHSNAGREALALLGAARPVETFCCPLSPVIGTHVGPGTVALSFMSDIP